MADGWGLPLHLPLQRESAEEAGYASPESNYGVAAWSSYGSAEEPKKPTLLRGARKRVNLLPVILAILFPWLVFALIYTAMASTLHYSYPTWAYFVVSVGALVVVCLLFSSIAHIRAPRGAGTSEEPSWIVFYTFCVLLAFTIGLVAGEASYLKYTKPWFDMTTLNVYRGVDPVVARGQQLMDAGMIKFMPGVNLQKNMSMGFQDGGLYCVAPITSGGEPPVTYDFWAIGKDCCKASAPGFTCSNTRHPNPLGMVGVRLLDDHDLFYYQMAVKQAEAAYGITAAHPLFLTWRSPQESDDPSILLEKSSQSMQNWLLGYFGVQLAIVILAMFFYFKK
eukprot:gb/GFBE01041912.1/.p1 GENE.gb/GFBE01041912.1/~~gb/GFBE01041912.1/.p1  ORF type:complete len:336 (+),score=73.25 gb/GFBE01041912.1/:1-1008(+)